VPPRNHSRLPAAPAHARAERCTVRAAAFTLSSRISRACPNSLTTETLLEIQHAMQFDFAMVLIFVISAIGFGLTNLLIGALLRPKFPNPEKSMVYECGERPIGNA